MRASWRTWPCTTFAGKHTVSDVTEGKPSSYIFRVLKLESSTSKPSARKSVVQNGAVSHRANTRGRPTVIWRFVHSGRIGHSLNRRRWRTANRFTGVATLLHTAPAACDSRAGVDISPRAHRFPVTNARPSENDTTVRAHRFAHLSQGTLARVVNAKPSRASSPINELFSPVLRSCAISAQPIAPIRPGYGARTTLRPTYTSSARSTASLANVPPCTTMRLPSESRFETRMTFVNTFSIIDRHKPAMISSGVRPFFCSLTIELFINTVQRLPKCAGCSLRNAACAISLV